MKYMDDVSILTIDGPSGSGKGTIAQLIAKDLDWHYLDSGSIYRVLGYSAMRNQIEFNDEKTLSALAAELDVAFYLYGEHLIVLLEGEDVSPLIRSECAGNAASKVAAHPSVRTALLQRQQNFCQSPGLVTDGRDMGTVVFPHAVYKVFLTASAEKRAKRRYKQLKEIGFRSSLSVCIAELYERDIRDNDRSVAPLKAADDALIIDSTEMGIEAIFERVRTYCYNAY